MPVTVFCVDSDVKLQAPIAVGVASKFDGMIPLYIAQVSQQIRSFCNRKFDTGDYKIFNMSPDSFNSQDSYRFRLPEWPIASGTLFLSYDPRGQFIPNVSLPVELTEDVDYTLDEATGWIEIISHGLSYHPRGLKAEWTGGYPINANVVQVPDEIKVACVLQVSFMLDRVASAQTGQQQEKGNRGGNMHIFNVDAQNGLTSEVQAMLREYRVPIIGRV